MNTVLTKKQRRKRRINNNISKKLDIIKNAIINSVKAKYIYLFGSYAYGSPHEKSDIDIYVVIPDIHYGDLAIMIGEIVEYLNEYKLFNIDLLLVKESKYLKCKEYSSFEKTICEKGILLYE